MKPLKNLKIFILFNLILFPCLISAQGYLHADGKYIYNGNGEEVILRGIGTGNWMIQEGYMMKTSDFAGSQHEIHAKILETVGAAKTDSFYNVWLNNHMTRTDVDSMKAWGFNSIRVAMHYLWFTPPIEDEPVAGEITWIETGFNLIDSLLDWCSDNEMYLILDMHGTPGGQGKDAAISDYDASKPSLWESQDNKNKLIALWKKLAERYKDEPWIGAYDMINEPNWDFENSGNQNGCNCSQNTPLKELFEDIIDTIRKVDQNHIVIVEGNCWGNNYNGMTSLASYDNNMVISFHKYWNYNTVDAIQGFLNMRNNLDIPVWLGESGENSNTWFTNAIQICEDNHVGWSWWPVKKNGINNVLMVNSSESYEALIDYWHNGGTAPSEDKAFDALLEWAENQKFENCNIQYDVIDAMIRQPNSYDSKPFKKHTIGQTIYAVDYDLGRYNVTYTDKDSANYHVTEGTYTNWNEGWAYRNDGVDIQTCTDSETNGFNVGWTEDGEWLSYTIYADTAAGYTLNIRYASGGSGATVRMEIDGVPAYEKITFTGTGGWQTWQTKSINGFIFPAGSHKLKFIFEKGGINLNYLKFTNPVSISSIEFKALDAQTIDGDTVQLILNKAITTDAANIVATEFEVSSNGVPINVTGFKISAGNNRVLEIGLESPIFYGDVATLSYSGTSILNGEQELSIFTDFPIRNSLPVRYTIPGKIQAENFYFNNGLVLETCTDAGGGQNTGYAAAGDYLDYLVNVTASDIYSINYRVATTASNAKLMVQIDNSGTFVTIDTIQFASTGGWQTWQTQSSSINLPGGRYTLRLKVLQGEHNLNWFEVAIYTGTNNLLNNIQFMIFPNPATDYINVSFQGKINANTFIYINDITGKRLLKQVLNEESQQHIDIGSFERGLYFISILRDNEIISVNKFVKR